jgi:hypothetical protein
MFAMAGFRVGWLLVALLLCGCAGVPGVPLTDMRSIKRVAVISLVGDKFTVQKISLNPFDSKPKPMPIAAWGIDQLVVKKVSSVLARRFEVRPLAYQPVEDANDVAVKVAEGVRNQSGQTDIDAYIVVTRGLFEEGYGYTRKRYFGLGIVEHLVAFKPRVDLYVLYDITVVDGHDLSVVASTQNGYAVGPTRWMNIEWRELDESWMPASLDAAQNMRLKGAVTEILDRNLPATIESMKLLQ